MLKMRSARLAFALAVSLLLLVSFACGGENGGDGSAGGEPQAREISAKDFYTRNFDRSTTIDNEWFPLQPGMQFIYEGSTREEGKRIPHRLVATVTDLTKVIAGARNIVVWERDFRAGELVEAELALFAQDSDGNVWHLGQYPEEYEDGRVVAAPTWFHGLKGAKAGITMKAKPRLGAPSYAQGFAPPPINWVDRAETYRVGEKTCVPAGCYEDALVIREFEVGKPDSYQLKYFAPGVGNVRVGWLGKKDQDREVLALVDLVRLGPQALSRARREALKLERHAYKISKDVYAHTPPSTRMARKVT
jgi:hypothetical protein